MAALFYFAVRLGRNGALAQRFTRGELVKACCLLHEYKMKEGVGIYDPRTGEIWTNPTLADFLGLEFFLPHDVAGQRPILKSALRPSVT